MSQRRLKYLLIAIRLDNKETRNDRKSLDRMAAIQEFLKHLTRTALLILVLEP